MSKELVICANPHETRVAIVEDGQLCEIYVEREKEFALVGSIYKGRVTRVLPGMQSAFVDVGLDSDAFLYVSDFLEDLEEYDQIVTTVEGKVQKMEQQGGQVFAQADAPAPAQEPPEVVSSAAAPADTTPAAAAAPAEPAPVAPRSDDLPGESRAPAGQSYTSAPADTRSGFRGPRFGRDRGGERGGRGRGGRWGRQGGHEDRGNRGARGDRRPGREFPASKYASHRPYGPPSEEPADQAGHEPIILPGETLSKYKDRVPAAPAPDVAEQPAEANLRVTPGPAAAFDELHAEVEMQPSAAPPVETFFAAPEPAIQPAEKEIAGPPARFPAPSEVTQEPPGFAAAGAVEKTDSAPEADPDLTDEENLALAEHLAEAEHEMAQEEATQDDLEDRESEVAEAAEEEEAEGPAGMYEADETDQEIRQGILDAAAGAADEAHAAAEEYPAAEQPPSQARVESTHRARFQQPMRRGGHRRGGGMPRGRPHHQRPQPPRRTQSISELLKAGQEIIVQIAKEPLGKKGARITSHVALPGRFLVYMPTVDHVGVSRKINSADKRARLRHLVQEARGTFPGGFIVRTAAEAASDEEIRADIEFLGKTWTEILQRSEQRKAPSILHRDLNLVERILRDHLSTDYTAIWIDSQEEYTKVVEFVGRFQPSLVSRVKLYTKDAPIFEEFGIQQEIDKSLRPKVWLKSGGYIVINHTEALVAIDVNTGKFVGKGSTRLEDTIVRTNIEAVKEVVRQIRLRDLGGIIVVDFIDMEERRNREKVMQALEDALRTDRAPSKVLPFNEFGLVAITRKRTKQALERVLCQPCPACSGSGMVKSLPTLCYEIQAEARKMAAEMDSGSLTLRVHPEVAKALKTRESALVDELEHWIKKSVIIQSDPTLHWEQYDIY